MNIRPATPEDFDAVMAISDQVNLDHHQALPELFLHPKAMADSRAFWMDHLPTDDQLFLVAEDAEGVTGFITAKISENHVIPYFTSDRICRIGTIAVTADKRKRGTGNRLMKAAEDWARQRGASQIHLTVMDFNRGALAFYEKGGYGLLSRTMAKSLDDRPSGTLPDR